MSNQPENEHQQYETVTPEEVRQSLLAELEAGKQAIDELSDEQLEEVAGGSLNAFLIGVSGLGKYGRPAETLGMTRRGLKRWFGNDMR